jgi:hypothetical protein
MQLRREKEQQKQQQQQQYQHVAALSIRRVVEAYSKGGLLTNDQPEAQRKLL